MAEVELSFPGELPQQATLNIVEVFDTIGEDLGHVPEFRGVSLHDRRDGKLRSGVVIFDEMSDPPLEFRVGEHVEVEVEDSGGFFTDFPDGSFL